MKELIQISCVENSKQLLHLAEILQGFYYSVPVEEMYIELSCIKNLYYAVAICLLRTPVNNYTYFSGKIGFLLGDNSESSYSAIQKHILTLKAGVYSTFLIDNVLRCIVVAIRDNPTNLNKNEIRDIADKLEWYNNQRILIETISKLK